MAERRLKSSVQADPVTWIVFRISRPAKIACVRLGETSKAAIGRPPVLWVERLGGEGLASEIRRIDE